MIWCLILSKSADWLRRTAARRKEKVELLDAAVIGAGLSGMYQIHRLQALGLASQGFEAGADVGGTWYWNRYPGARFDSESYSYGYSFSAEVLREWNWSEHFSPQPETLRYCNFVADKLNLRKHFRFGMRLVSARFSDGENAWSLEFDNGETVRCRILVTAVGPLSAPVMPELSGLETFAGEVQHTGLWPKGEVAVKGRRIGVIGTGATGVQVIQEVAKTAGHLTVFQRTPNWCAPLNNRPISAPEQASIKASYDRIFRLCNETANGFMHDADPRKALEASAEEREAFWEKLYSEPGFGIWLANYSDILVDQTANDLISAFMARKIRERVRDPVTAAKLIPGNHGFGTRRVPMETNYYEAYNQANVDLVDLSETPIECATPNGLITAAGEVELDLLILATGFDAVRGALDRIDIVGVNGVRLKDRWDDGPVTYLGLAVSGFPNLLTLVGPHNSATFCNIPRCIEQNVDWVTDAIRYMAAHGYRRIEATREAEEEWTSHVFEVAQGLLMTKTRSWFMGLNANIQGRDKPRLLVYAGGAPRYRERCDAVAAQGYAGFQLT